MQVRLRRILNDDGLLFVLLGASFVAHLSLGSLNGDHDEVPYLPNRANGRTSVSVQLIAQNKPAQLTPNWTPHEIPEVFRQEIQRLDLENDHALPDRKVSRRADEPQPRPTPAPPPNTSRHDPEIKVVLSSAEAEIADANNSKNFTSRASVGADVAPSFKTRTDPRYPPELLLSGVEADVYLIVTVGATGRVVSLAVHESSGYEAMDQSAIDAVKHWQFVPAMQNGVPITKRVIVPVSFRIRR